MRFTKILALLGIAAILFTGCKKDDDNPSGGNSFSVDEEGNVNFGADADGALYSIGTKLYDGTTSTNFDETEYAYAWFGNAMSPAAAGVVTANDYELTTFGGGFNWYTAFGLGGEIFTNGNTVTWDVEGASGVTGFTHNDNTPFPGGGTFTLPAEININTNFTLTHAATTNADAVIYGVIGNLGQKTKSVMGNSGSVTFTAAEMNEVCNGGGDPIGFLVMPVSIKPTSYNGKKYYFVKQSESLRETVTQ